MTRRRLFLLALGVVLVSAACSDRSDRSSGQPTSTSRDATTTEGSPAEPDVAGIWVADLGRAVLQLRLETGSDGHSSGVLDSVNEGVTDVPVTVAVDGDGVVVSVEAISAVFEGNLEGDTLSGVWTQAGTEIPVVFERQAVAITVQRPQEPRPPLPYRSTEVRFDNGPVTLAGTLVVPDGPGPFPAAILISGSGPQDRDSTLMGHRPFLVIADALARRGIATLRYDDRGVAESTGTHTGATTTDLATDAVAAVELLGSRDDIGDIGLVGHSEGGLIAPMAAAAADDVRFVVSLAGPGLPGSEVLSAQTEDLLRAEGVADDVIARRLAWTAEVISLSASDRPTADVASSIREVLADVPAGDILSGATEPMRDELVEQFVEAFTDPWMRFFLAYDPAPAWAALEVPVLALIGDLDLQVSSRDNLPALRDALEGNRDATVEELAGLNHLFQSATTGSVAEYGAIEETIAPAVLDRIAGWILERSSPGPSE